MAGHKRYGVTISHYGGASFGLAELTRQLARREVPILEIRGCAYPEMARAEQVRQARLAGVGTLVFVDSHVETSVETIETLVKAAETSGIGMPAGDAEWARGLELCAVHLDVIESMVAAEERAYANSPVEAAWSGVKVPAVPVASPWNRDGSSLLSSVYLTDSEAFLLRAGRASGATVYRVRVGMRSHAPAVRYRSANVDAPKTGEPGAHFALCVPSFGRLDLDQMTALYALEKAGMTVFSIHDCAWIDQARSWLTEQALAAGKGVFFVDHDIVFEPNDVLRLCAQALDKRSVVAAPYSMRGPGKNVIGAFDVPPGPVQFFEGGDTLPAYYSGLGFAAVPREVLEGIELPSLASFALDGGTALRPWYALDCSTGFYAGEDVSFCNRVHDLTVKQRQATDGIEWVMTHSGRPARVYLDTRVRIFHRGSYDYGIEDTGIVVPRIESLSAMMTPSRAEALSMILNAGTLPPDLRVAAMDYPAP